MFEKLIGLRVVSIRIYKSHKSDYKMFSIPDFIFFDDGETFMQLDVQDPYEYHDASITARMFDIIKNKALYDSYLENTIDVLKK